MRCPRCGKNLRRSRKDPAYGLCDNCRKRYIWNDDESSTYSGTKGGMLPVIIAAVVVILIAAGVLVFVLLSNKESGGEGKKYRGSVYVSDVKTFEDIDAVYDFDLNEDEKREFEDKMLEYLIDGKKLQGIAYSSKYIFDEAWHGVHLDNAHKSVAVYFKSRDEAYIYPEPEFSDAESIEELSDKDKYRFSISKAEKKAWVYNENDDFFNHAILAAWPYAGQYGTLDGTELEKYSHELAMSVIELTLTDSTGSKMTLWYGEPDGHCFIGFSSLDEGFWEHDENSAFYFDKQYADTFADMARVHSSASKAADKELRNSIPKVGMTESEVRNCRWGNPKKINRTTHGEHVEEQWVYDVGYVYLTDGIVTAVTENNPLY